MAEIIQVFEFGKESSIFFRNYSKKLIQHVVSEMQLILQQASSNIGQNLFYSVLVGPFLVLGLMIR